MFIDTYCRHDFWYSIKDKYGVNMDAIIPKAKQDAFSKEKIYTLILQ